MSKWTLEIKGDTNDADYIESRHMFNDNDLIFSKDFLLEGVESRFIKGLLSTPDMTYKEFATYLGQTLMQLNTHHNWARSEYDNQREAYPTIEKFLNIAFGINLTQLEEEHPIDLLEIRENLYEIFSDIFPYGEFGIHTIHTIKIYPSPVETIYFDRECWASWYNAETLDVIDRATNAPIEYIRIPEGSTSVINHKGEEYFVVPWTYGNSALVKIGSFLKSTIVSDDVINESSIIKKLK